MHDGSSESLTGSVAAAEPDTAAEATQTPEADGDTSGQQPPPPPQSLARRAIPWLVIVIVAAGVAILLRAFVFQTFFVPSESMMPTLDPGDRMVVLKLGLGSLHRGEIVVFRRPPRDVSDIGNEDLVKRVIGLPGETIWSSGNAVYINGKPLAEPWLPKHDPLGTKAITRQRIPAGQYFMMGDNRAISYDSRYWGDLSGSSVVGQVIFVVWRHGHPYFKTF